MSSIGGGVVKIFFTSSSQNDEGMTVVNINAYLLPNWQGVGHVLDAYCEERRVQLEERSQSWMDPSQLQQKPTIKLTTQYNKIKKTQTHKTQPPTWSPRWTLKCRMSHGCCSWHVMHCHNVPLLLINDRHRLSNNLKITILISN